MLTEREAKRALISVSDKTGVVELGCALAKLGWEIISTGGTARVLKEAGLEVIPVSAVTGFPEILDGRVKTLHPKIHGGILARLDREEHRRQMAEQGIAPIDLVVVNLYPFAQTVSRPGVTLEEAVENIDIGGPAMVRAAAKNFAHTAVVVNPERYAAVIKELKEKGDLTLQTRCRLAAEAFAHTAHYDALIAAYFSGLPQVEEEQFPPVLTLPFGRVQALRYGENPQQAAAFYASPGSGGLPGARQLQGKELSFNNLHDLNAAWELVLEFDEPTVVAVKHANPCGVGSAASVLEAYHLAYEADPVSIFGGIIAVNRTVDEETAREMLKIFLEVVAAPAFSEGALQVFAAKKNIRLLELAPEKSAAGGLDFKKVAGGLLLQTVDREPVGRAGCKVVTERAPSEEEWRQLIFAQKVVKHVKSNAIVIAREGQTVGIGAGQMSRIGAAKIALAQAGEKARGAELGSDAFFPFPDTVEAAAAAGVTAIIQPGGSLQDEASIAACNRYGLAMVFTGRRYFKH